MEIIGVVLRGQGKGKKLGFPTANLKIGDDKDNSQLEKGVFIGQAWIDKKEYRVAIFIGLKKEILEAHILDFSGDLYGKEIEIKVGKKIRDVIKFNNYKELIDQIKRDVNAISFKL